jgi:shikimate kinase
MEELRAILSARAPLYARCEVAVATSDRTPSAVAREVRAALGLDPVR